ncbi:hypothetical protein BCR34DRAFT_608505 [Clohesyomyces aquaticus]|uniref:Uncharacterized protein n=1 Tax=Clohesyomyces aquaticus TaxID=1231657 RepID=A0A1Y1Y6K3_9PLEO|nr:hypothetical protein BCR34DRAFT_608505 [Clohesyomyces aquaticus]
MSGLTNSQPSFLHSYGHPPASDPPAIDIPNSQLLLHSYGHPPPSDLPAIKYLPGNGLEVITDIPNSQLPLHGYGHPPASDSYSLGNSSGITELYNLQHSFVEFDQQQLSWLSPEFPVVDLMQIVLGQIQTMRGIYSQLGDFESQLKTAKSDLGRSIPRLNSISKKVDALVPLSRQKCGKNVTEEVKQGRLSHLRAKQSEGPLRAGETERRKGSNRYRYSTGGV